MQRNFYKNKKSLLKLLLILTIISYTLFYSPQKNIISGDTSYNNDELSNIYFPNTSDQDITVITPENITYTEPMEGYYPGTIGFEHEKDGTTSTDIDFVDIDYSGSNCVPRIISGLDGHEKVLQMDDDSASEQVDIRSLFDVTQEYGTIELYWKSTNVSKICYFDVRSGDAAKIRIAIWQDKFQYWDGTYHDIVGAVSETWYRLRIDFESGSGGYKGLSADTYFIYINEVKYGPYNFESSVDYLDDIRITTHDTGTGYDNYFDAIGYSWDPTYLIGENLKEGLLLSFENSTNLDWIGYSLDGQSNKTILGDTTITMPNDGSHTIQVFGNDSLGTIYSSDIRYFSVDTLDPVITINSPLTGEVFADLPPEFNLTIDEVNLDATWYTLDGGATTIDITELTGYIDLTAWNNAPIGNVTIRFYARDIAGNEVYQEVIVIKSSSQQEPPPGIPGFNIALLCLTIVIITVSSLKIKKYKVK